MKWKNQNLKNAFQLPSLKLIVRTCQEPKGKFIFQLNQFSAFMLVSGRVQDLKINGWNMSSWRFASDYFPFKMGDL